jgi:hypothetical protein
MNAHKASSHTVIAGEELTSTDSKHYPTHNLSLLYVVKSILLSFRNIVVTVVNSPILYTFFVFLCVCSQE